MRSRIYKVVCVALACAIGCREQTPIPNTPVYLKILSGAHQSGDASSPLDSLLVVQVLDAGNRPVSGVPLAWQVSGGGSVSATSTVSDTAGKSSVKWTLAPTAGTQVVTVTSPQIGGASVSFTADNGATISGTVTEGGGTPFAVFSRAAPVKGGAARLSWRASMVHAPRPSSRRIVVGFRDDVLGVAAAASTAYRSMAMARQVSAAVQQRLAALGASHPLDLKRAEISPALLAARLRVDDSAQVDIVLQALQADPSVAWAERDGSLTIRDGAPRPMSAAFLAALNASLPAAPHSSVAAATVRYPSDPSFYAQLWMANMLDLPRAWTVTTGNSSVVVASVDMGIRFDHPNMAPNLTSDGYDFVSIDSTAFDSPQPLCDGGTFQSADGKGIGPNPDPTDPDDLEFDDVDNCWAHNTLGDHGLWTAGIIGAAGNQGLGVAGVNWNVKIRPIRVLDITGSGSYFDIAQGVLYAAGLPATGPKGALVQAPSRAPIISMSLGGGSSASSLRNAINAAINAGSLVVASAGNDGLDFPTYPAAYNGVMGVAAVGMDGVLATYSNAGSYISVAAPGGDFRLDDNGGGGVLGPGWDFESKRATYLFGYGTSASAPYVSGIAALLLAQTPGLTAAALSARIEQFATRPAGAGRSDSYGWGIVNAYNSLMQQNGPARQTYVRLVSSTTGSVVRTAAASNGTFALTRLPAGTYYLQAGEDDSGDGVIGTPGRRFGWFGGAGTPTTFTINAAGAGSQSVSMVLGYPYAFEPNDDVAHANMLSVGSYAIGSITASDLLDTYSVVIPTAGLYIFETSGLVGSCGFGVELDTRIGVSTQAGSSLGSNDNFTSQTGHYCSQLQLTLNPGTYTVTVRGSGAAGLATSGLYRLEVRAGPGAGPADR